MRAGKVALSELKDYLNSIDTSEEVKAGFSSKSL
jgi:hypothetical protein